MLEAMGRPAWVVDAGSLCVAEANQAAAALLGRSLETLRGADATALLSTPEDLSYWDNVREEVRKASQDPLRSGAPDALHSDTLLLMASGELLPVTRRIAAIASVAASDEPLRFLVSIEDRSEACQQQQASEQRVAELQATLESTDDGILVTDMAGRISGFNRRFAQIWGMPEELLLEHQDEAVYDWMRRSVVDAEAYQRRVDSIQDATLSRASERLVLHSGQQIERVTQPQRSRGRYCGRVWAFRDLTALVDAGRRIETLSTTDALTGLCNRHQLGERLTESIHQAHRDSSALALLIVDLDRFKQVNDSFGHEAGDRVLLDATERLKSCLRQGDLVARVGGDQFALLVHGADERGAEATAQRVLLAFAGSPCTTDGVQFTLTCSIGLALFPADGSDADQLVRSAENATLRAKIGGRACLRFHQARHDADLRHRMRLDHAMRQALASQRFRLMYQPQIDLRSGAVIGAEALIRWRDPELGELAPADFIPVAEETGFIIAIGEWVLCQAVRQASTWHAIGLKVPVSINVSALQFQQVGFVDRVAEVLRENNLPGHLLELELTESILVVDADEALARLSLLSRLGVQLAIDDFGTGYSSLAYLKRFPIDRLKIDGSFVAGVPADDSDAGIVRAIIEMSRALRLRVIAEGVETEPQRAFLRDAGCDGFQGFLFAPALDPLSFVERLRNHQPRRHQRLTLVPSF